MRQFVTYAFTFFVRNMQRATRISVCVIAVSKSHEYFVESSLTFFIFFDDDAYAFTSTRRNFFPRRRKGFDFDEESMFFPRRRALIGAYIGCRPPWNFQDVFFQCWSLSI